MRPHEQQLLRVVQLSYRVRVPQYPGKATAAKIGHSVPPRGVAAIVQHGHCSGAVAITGLPLLRRAAAVLSPQLMRGTEEMNEKMRDVDQKIEGMKKAQDESLQKPPKGE